MNNTNKKHKLSRQAEAMELYRRGFSQNEIAEILGINRSTVSRYFCRPTSAEIEDFYENHAYGSFFTEDGEFVPFNRRYKPLSDKKRWVENIIKTEWYYQDGTDWEQRIYNSVNKFAVYQQDKKHTCWSCSHFLQKREEVYQSRVDGSPVCKKCYEKSLN
jgi:transposase-like protein